MVKIMYISSLPVPFTKFEGNKSEHLGQLFVPPQMIEKKIKKMKDNKSPGVVGISPKLLKKIVEQISTPLAKVFNLSLEEGMKRNKHYTAILLRIEEQTRQLQASEFNISCM